MRTTKAKSPRPRGIIILTILAILIGLFGIAGGAGLLLNANTTFATLDALIAVAIGILCTAVGIGIVLEKDGRGL